MTAMKKQPAIERQSSTAGIITVLSVSPQVEDHQSLQAIIGQSKHWMQFTACDLASALALLEKYEIAVLLCERDLLPGGWTDVLERIQSMPNAPSLIVTSRLADEHLWAEALNLGAWDVLAKPFDRMEVIRSIKSAWQHWHDKASLGKSAGQMASAAG